MLIKRAGVFPFVIVSLWFLAGCGRSEQIRISTEPVVAEVWLDGEFLGDTPLEVPLDLREDHKIELVANGFRRVEYEVSQYLPSHELSLRLYPESFSRSSGIPPDFVTGGISPDWGYQARGPQVKNVFDETASIDFGDYSVPERMGLSELGPNQIITNLVFANDSHHVAFQMAESPSPKCGIVPTQLWLTTLEEPENQILALNVPDGNIPVCGTSLGFSSDSKWLWVVYEEELHSMGYSFRLIDVNDPLNHQVVLSEHNVRDPFSQVVILKGDSEDAPITRKVLLNGHSLGFFPQWSQDGKWVAIELIDGSTDVFHLIDGVWSRVSVEIHGKPVGWSPDNGEIWVIKQAPDESPRLQVYALASSELLGTYDLGGIEANTANVMWSPDGKNFAIAYETKKIENDKEVWTGAIMVGARGTDEFYIFDDLEYQLVLYWLEDNERIAVIAKYGSYPNREYIMNILTAPRISR